MLKPHGLIDTTFTLVISDILDVMIGNHTMY